MGWCIDTRFCNIAILQDFVILHHYLNDESSVSASKQNILKFIHVGSNKVHKVHEVWSSVLDLVIYLLKSSMIIFMIVLINSTFAELLLHLQNISSSNTPYVYPKDKSLWLKFVILRFRFPMKKNIFFVILYSLILANSITLRTYSMQQFECNNWIRLIDRKF